MCTGIKLFYDHSLTQCYLLEFLQEFQTHADHTQDVRNWKKGY